mgnify:FL=1
MKTLTDLVEHHAGEEERSLFPLAESVLTEKQLTDIQEQLVQYRKQYEQEKAHPGLWGKVYLSMTNPD